jgi:hypothetical protein
MGLRTPDASLYVRAGGGRPPVWEVQTECEFLFPFYFLFT